MALEPKFEVELTGEAELGETLLVGIPTIGLVGLSALDYLIKTLEFEEVGHIETRGLPDIAPFADGEPRYPIRLYTAENVDFTILVSELFVPVWAADPFAETLFEWLDTTDIEEITILYGTPYPHAPEEHDVFYVANPAYRERRLANTDLQPLKGGFFDGVVGELVTWGLDPSSLPVGVYVTPAHPPGPDLEAALRFLEELEKVYGFTCDEGELRKSAEDLKRYYEELGDRLQTLEESEQGLASRDYPEDRMYM